LFVCLHNLHNFDLYIFPISFENEIYLVFLTLGLSCCALCRCLIEVVVAGAHRRSDHLAKGKAVLYEPDSPPDSDDEYDAMEDVRTRVDASIARDSAGRV
jgi:hypothetical protein